MGAGGMAMETLVTSLQSDFELASRT